MEIADVFAINKADLPGAQHLEQDIRAMQSVANDAGNPTAAPVRRVTSIDGTGVEDLLQVIHQLAQTSGTKSRNAATWSLRLTELLREELLESLPTDAIHQHAARVAEKMEDPYAALAALTALAKNRHAH